jgi:hypothetical protein
VRIAEQLLDAPSVGMDDLEVAHPGVHRRTLQRDLHAVVDLGLLRSEGAARSTRYFFRNQ